MKTKSAVRLGLFVRDERDRSLGGDYYRMRAHVVIIGANAWEMSRIDRGDTEHIQVAHDRIRNVSDELVHGLYLNNLSALSLGNSDDTPRHLFGFEVEFKDVYSVDRSKAAAMLKTLTTIDKRMSKTAEKYGNPATFGAYLARVAEAIGADAMVAEQGKSTGWSYDHADHRIFTIADGIYHVDGRVRAWVNEPELKAAQAAQVAS